MINYNCILNSFNNRHLILGLSKKCSKPGESVPAGDGCNTCICNEDGTLGGCTLIACIIEISGITNNS